MKSAGVPCWLLIVYLYEIHCARGGESCVEKREPTNCDRIGSSIGFYLILSYQLPTYPYIPVDADAIPKTLGWLLLALSVGLFFSKDRDSEEQKAKRHIPKKDVISLLVVFLFVFLYITFFWITRIYFSDSIICIQFYMVLRLQKAFG